MLKVKKGAIKRELPHKNVDGNLLTSTHSKPWFKNKKQTNKTKVLCYKNAHILNEKKKIKANRLPRFSSLVPRLWKSVQVTDPLDQDQKIRHLAQKKEKLRETAEAILFKVMTSVPPLKTTNTCMNE